MGVVAKPSQIILLLEDALHERFIYRYLRKLGYGRHLMRFARSPSGVGSAEQRVRERFALEVRACTRRQAKTTLIVLVDADTHTVQERIAQFDSSLREAGIPMIPDNTRRIARLVPKRNIETWILCLFDVQVNEETDYKHRRENWTEMVRAAALTLHTWTRPNAVVPPSYVDSLWSGMAELQKIGL